MNRRWSLLLLFLLVPIGGCQGVDRGSRRQGVHSER